MLINIIFVIFDLMLHIYVSECFLNKLFKLFLFSYFVKTIIKTQDV
jgi:hypothetical protein